MIPLAPVRTAAPTAPLLALADAKEHLKVEDTSEDRVIAAYAAAAEGLLDGYSGILGCALVTQEWSQSFDGFPACDRFRLPLGPLQQVDSISYYDTAGASQTFTSYRAVTDAIGPMVVLNDGASWPSTAVRPDAVTVAWTCGYGNEVVDELAPIVQAAKLLVGDWHYGRENTVAGMNVAEMPFAVKALIARFRKVPS